MPIHPGTPEAVRAAARLRAAAEVVAECMADGRDKTDVLRRIGVAVANLTEHDCQAVCRRCANVFSFDAARFRAKRLDPPRHCYWCRRARQSERERVGLARPHAQDRQRDDH